MLKRRFRPLHFRKKTISIYSCLINMSSTLNHFSGLIDLKIGYQPIETPQPLKGIDRSFPPIEVTMSIPWSRVTTQIQKNFTKWNLVTIAEKPSIPMARMTTGQQFKREMSNSDVWPFFVGMPLLLIGTAWSGANASEEDKLASPYYQKWVLKNHDFGHK